MNIPVQSWMRNLSTLWASHRQFLNRVPLKLEKISSCSMTQSMSNTTQTTILSDVQTRPWDRSWRAKLLPMRFTKCLHLGTPSHRTSTAPSTSCEKKLRMLLMRLRVNPPSSDLENIKESAMKTRTRSTQRFYVKFSSKNRNTTQKVLNISQIVT